jgi:hypothetical protein
VRLRLPARANGRKEGVWQPATAERSVSGNPQEDSDHDGHDGDGDNESAERDLIVARRHCLRPQLEPQTTLASLPPIAGRRPIVVLSFDPRARHRSSEPAIPRPGG